MKKMNFYFLAFMVLFFAACGKDENVEPTMGVNDGVFTVVVDGKSEYITQLGYGYDEGQMFDRPKDNRLSFYGVDVVKKDSSYLANIPIGKEGIILEESHFGFTSFNYTKGGELYELVPAELSEEVYNEVESVKYVGKEGKYVLFHVKGNFKSYLEAKESKERIPVSGTYFFKVGARER